MKENLTSGKDRNLQIYLWWIYTKKVEK